MKTDATKTHILNIHLAGQPVAVDLNRLTPHARSLAEAIADTPGRNAVDIWMETEAPIRDITPDWKLWFTPEEADKPERRPWRGWSTVPLGQQDPHERLEREAAKIPPGWHVLGANPRRDPRAAIREVPTTQVLAWLRDHGRPITAGTWAGYVSRGQSPAPIRHVGRTPLWDLDEIERWHLRHRNAD